MPNLTTSLPSFTITPPFNVLEAAASSSTITVGSGRRLARAARQTIASVVDTPAHLLDPSHLPQVDGGEGEKEEEEEKAKEEKKDEEQQQVSSSLESRPRMDIVRAARAAKAAGKRTEEVIYLDELLGPGWDKPRQ